MLKRVVIDRFQSIKHADLSLGSFTVIVGPSSSGKSATLRSIRALVRNTNTPEFVSRGSTTFSVRGVFEDITVALERGKSKAVYILVNGKERRYDKCGVSVPSDVQDVLRMPDVGGVDLNLTTQFDTPFLLNETGTVAANVLGQLTHASTLYDASGNALKMRTRHATAGKAKAAEVIKVTEQLQQYNVLDEQAQLLNQATKLLEHIKESEAKLAELTNLIDTLTRLKEQYLEVKSVDRQQTEATMLRIQEELVHVQAKCAKLSELEKTVNGLSNLANKLKEINKMKASYQAQIEAAEEKQRALLATMKVCPTCGQKIQEGMCV